MSLKNPLLLPIAIMFAVLSWPLMAEAQVVVQAEWLNAADGNWNNAANWDSAAFPNNGVDTFEVTIDVGGATYEVTLNTIAAIDSLLLDSSDATLNIGSNGSLNVLNTAQLDSGTLLLRGGTITGGTVTQSGGNLQFSSPSSGIRNVLDGVTVNGDVLMSGGVANLILRNGTDLQNDALLTANGTTLVVDTAITLNNTIDLTGSSSTLGAVSNGALTLSSTAQVNLTGSTAQIRTDAIPGEAVSFYPT